VGAFQLTLYLTGDSAKSQYALDNLRSILEAQFPGSYELTVVDILEEPHQAEAQGILATPTLIKRAPSPERRVIGDFSDQDKVLAGLGLARRGAGTISAGGS
jgi:circadian clock protein KaiB